MNFNPRDYNRNWLQPRNFPAESYSFLSQLYLAFCVSGALSLPQEARQECCAYLARRVDLLVLGGIPVQQVYTALHNA